MRGIGTSGKVRPARGLRRFSLVTLPALAIALLAVAALPLHANETSASTLPLVEALKASGSKPARFVLANGETVVGRLVKIDGKTLTVRRPSAGLRSLAVTDILAVNIKAGDGVLIHGKVASLADGTIGWTADRDKVPDVQITGVVPETQSKTGGPLIRLGDDALRQNETTDEDIEAEKIAVKPPTSDQPEAGINPADAAVDSTLVSLLVSADQADESDKLMYFRLTLSEPAKQSILVIYTMINGTAVAPGDYNHRQGVVVFEPGQTQAVVATSIVNDEAAEGEESFEFFVTGDPAAVTIKQRKVVAKIKDDDG